MAITADKVDIQNDFSISSVELTMAEKAEVGLVSSKYKTAELASTFTMDNLKVVDLKDASIGTGEDIAVS